MRNNRKWIAAVVAVIVVAAIVAIAGGAFSTHARRAAPRRVAATSPPHRHTLRPVYSPPSQGNGGSNSVQQRSDDARIAKAAPGPAFWSAVAVLKLPAPTPSAQFPAISHASRQRPQAYATAFIDELLTITFAKQSRRPLLAWAVSETSPTTIPGTPISDAAKVLDAYLTGSGSPVPTATVWAANAVAGVTWSVSNVTMTSEPTWTQVLATGWQPPDPRMDFLDVTGNLTVTETGQPPVVKPFSLQLGLGTAEYHNGYGAMTVYGWTVG
jgi:hypothetical protein